MKTTPTYLTRGKATRVEASGLHATCAAAANPAAVNAATFAHPALRASVAWSDF